MKVQVVMTIDVDPTEWARANGWTRTDGLASAVRGDMPDYVAEVVQQARTFSESGAKVLRCE